MAAVFCQRRWRWWGGRDDGNDGGDDDMSCFQMKHDDGDDVLPACAELPCIGGTDLMGRLELVLRTFYISGILLPIILVLWHNR
jgi:hypothetical protein